ncbi:MAG: glycerol-3-phosphate dehydrogenase/oxidase [Spirochaetes bacterium]|nr:MAG: glycerol-3-phosphate dehydrogenase/oxidase [Spirochaetota bacterium]
MNTTRPATPWDAARPARGRNMKRFIEKYKGEEYDIVVIGGGITGAAVAYDAASRGLKVALLEKNDFGWATSAATSKLIHGGLRYLNNMEFGLVRESLRERRILENIAPNLVYPIPFMVPNYHKFKNNKWIIKIGLTLYDILSFDKKWTWDKSKRIPNHSSYSKKKVMTMEPNVRKLGLTGAALYYDCQSIFPERLTLAFVKSAESYGAHVANYARVLDFLYSDGKGVAGVKVQDILTGKTVEVKARLTINCAGPWADIVLNLAQKGNGNHHIRRSEGIHLILKNAVEKNAVTMLTPGGRHFFVVPWRGHSLVGTTDKEYVGNPDEYHVSRASIEEFITEINGSFGDGGISYKDVQYAYGGLRPLVDTQTEGTYKSSRKYEIYNNALQGFEGLITVEGGKYTTSRKLAVNVLKMVQVKLKTRLPRSTTALEYLKGCEIEDMAGFLDRARKQNPDFSIKTLEYLARNYGTEYNAVLELARADKKLAQQVSADGEILAEVVYAVRVECARTLSDIMLRRTGTGTLGYPGDKIMKLVAAVAAKELKWDAARVRKEIASVKAQLVLPNGEKGAKKR